MTIRPVVLAITLLWLAASPIAASEPHPQASSRPPAAGKSGGGRALRATEVPATPFATDPSTCTVQPRTLDEVRRLIVQAKRTEATPAVTPSSLPIAELPAGTSADAETVAAITTTTEQFFACLNAGDLLRFLALVTDDVVVSLDRELGFPLDDPSIATPQPALDTTPITLSAIGEVRILHDGRAGVLVTPASLVGGPIFFYFVREGNRWLIDGFVDVIQEPTETSVPCCTLPTPASPTSWQRVRDNNYEGVIVPEIAGHDFFRTLDGTEQPGYWTPSPAQIAELERQLLGYLTPPPGGDSPVPAEIWQNLSSYHRQYAGFITGEGDKQIEVNFFCSAYTGPWLTTPVVVLDGGDCFFRLTYDPTTGEFSNLRINGEA